MIGTPECNDSKKRMAAHSMVKGSSSSLAEECIHLCSAKARSDGVKSEVKYKKREEKAPMKKRHYHLQRIDDVTHFNVSMKAVGLQRGIRNGQNSMYHIRADPELGLGKIALR